MNITWCDVTTKHFFRHELKETALIFQNSQHGRHIEVGRYLCRKCYRKFHICQQDSQPSALQISQNVQRTPRYDKTQSSNNAESAYGWLVYLRHKSLIIQKAFLSHNITCAPRTFLTGRWCRPKKHSSTWEAKCKIKTSLNKCIDAKIT